MEQENLTETIIGCAITVHQTLGPGYLESVYQNALVIELTRAGLQTESHCRIPVYYREEPVGDFFADILVQGAIILELKAIAEIHPAHEAQLVNYLQATGLQVGLVLNFGASQLGIKRKHKTYKPKSPPVSPENPALLSKKSPAFTLIELLVAMAVLSILLVVLLNVVQSAATLWRTTENRMETYREARAALQVISSDLANFLPSTNTNYFSTNVSSTNQLAFLALLPRNSQLTNSLGDVCAVGYLLDYGNQSALVGANRSQSYNLYRYFIESNQTFTNLLAGNPFPNFNSSTNHSEILARNIIGFRVRPLATNASGNFTNWTQSASDPTPDLLEIELTAINNEAAIRLETNATNTNDPNYQKNTKTFIKRIKLNSP